MSSSNARSYIACGASVAGTRHIQNQNPCEDAWAKAILPCALVIAVADGLSSAEFGGKGAEIAVNSCVRNAVELLRTDEEDEEQDIITVIRTAAGAGREKIGEHAIMNEMDISSFATTLLMTVLTPDGVVCGHIGDGACVTLSEDVVSLLSVPGHARYANETAVLTGKNWDSQFRISSGAASAVICATDGCQGALVRRENGSYMPYSPFIVPLVRSLEQYTKEDRDLNSEIFDLLHSSRMQALSSDD
ncbi:MAG: PP2C family serine/threonine-protein phosphatase, partial [Methanospirillum sp.]|nr:PP2C family serine/threonine-protein phosphatase [Methanospirillum sp.]